jgi:4-hydroxy-3-polyprenylbenzoate decarboxylase
VEELVDHTIGRVLDLFDIEMAGMERWGEHSSRFPADGSKE